MIGILHWGLFFPILCLLRLLFFWLPALRSRISFEKKNLSETGCEPFSLTHEVADLCFEFSSEGEFQQVAALIEDAISLGKKCELVFFSPSVEKTIQKLWEKHPTQIRYFRYPLASYFPGSTFMDWATSRELIMVRYDLFPEFLLWSDEEHILKMVWLTFKKERLNGKTPSYLKRLFLKTSKLSIFATEEDAAYAEKWGRGGEAYDFRMEQIRRRLEKKDEKFRDVFPEHVNLKSQLDLYPRGKRILMGNTWPEDLDLLKNLPKEYFVVIIPHKLDEEIISEMRKRLSIMKRDDLIIAKKGILCELYGDFGKSYVGGGFGASVHSLLEPLISGSEHIACGPVHHRSTEFDLCQRLGHLAEVKNEQDFLNWAQEHLPLTPSHAKLNTIFHHYPKLRKELLSC